MNPFKIHLLMFRILFFFALCFMIFSCQSKSGSDSSDQGEVIYHLFQRSFYDSNGDGHGDLNGINMKLDYLQDLGVTSILLMPLYEADCYHNYFANDFETIDPEFGTMEDYLSLVKEIHRRGMKIYMDMETQYVAKNHQWWREGVGNPNSTYSEYILFEDEEKELPSTIIFNLRGLNSYDGRFINITTVNLKSPQVLEYNKGLFAHFLDPNGDGKFDDGVDGFRLDHAMDMLDNKPELSGLFESFWNPLILHLKAINPKVCIIAEQADWADPGFAYFEKAGVDRVFGFGLLYGILTFDKKELSKMADMLLNKRPEGKDFVVFLENHDIDRLPNVEENPDKRDLAASLLFTMGGIPSLYYGQEIGMRGKGGSFGQTDGNDIPRREAFEWYADNKGEGMALWYQNTGPWWDSTNVIAQDGISLEEQKGDEMSVYHHYKGLIEFYKSEPAIALGSFNMIENENPAVFTFVRSFQNKKILVMANLGDKSQDVTLPDTLKIGAAVYGDFIQKGNSVHLAPYHFCAARVE